MSRPFDFGTLTRQRTRIRQFGMCAVCGDRLDDLVEHAHHVIPNQSGNPADADHQALRTVENCVVICDACHERVHENGRYRTGAVAPPTYFPYSHGRDLAAHEEWVKLLKVLGGKIWT